MRFRGKLIDIGCIQHFTRVLITIAKLAKMCTLRITPNKLYFILSERVANGGVSIWCELMQGHFFNEYNMEGVNEEANEIFLELPPENLVRAMKTAQSAKSVKIKLTKKHSPCLTFEVEQPSLSSHSRTVVHDIPVHIIPRRLWDEFDEPEMPDFDISIYMPNARVLRNVVDRMKNLSNFVSISANQNGAMRVKVEADQVTVETHFKDLEYPTWSGPSDIGQRSRNRDPAEFVEARIDIRRLAQFLSGQQVNPSKIICNIVDTRVVHFFLLHDDVSLQYFMPAISL
ncbi:hypothetical protein LSH36_265g01028 [Paralvinella palmiformis]|uniref:Checkpoint protein n=1 Tax=Paralvinella palmiformis TaxID=53620 RepID=A0AAD9N3Y4_9ANNE|nr:hypothetical protein LSH36_265g01028 [Paralvinella palmiformis]